VKGRSLTIMLLACAACLTVAGCNAPGKPKLQDEVSRPDQVLDFPGLYKQNCAACHGEDGKNGAAISLSNPIYLATTGVENIRRITATGVSGTAMPPFGKTAGGMLTDEQIEVLATGTLKAWSSPGALSGVKALPYASSTSGDVAKGQAAYAIFCARCHGVDGTGANEGNGMRVGSIVEPAYLALVSDQGLRSLIIAGRPEQGMPDWRSDLTGTSARALTDQEIADIVAWITSHRIASPGQPYKQHQ
jgi:mono/diheme cytochrome c family protein